MNAISVRSTSWLQEDCPSDARNIIDAIGNLLYLIEQDCHNPNLVQSYISHAEERLLALKALIPEPPPLSRAGGAVSLAHNSYQG